MKIKKNSLQTSKVLTWFRTGSIIIMKTQLSRLIHGALVAFFVIAAGTLKVSAELKEVSLPSKDEINFIALVSGDKDLYGFYRKMNFEPIWIGREPIQQRRLKALKNAINLLDSHGLSLEVIDAVNLWDGTVDLNNPASVQEAEVRFTNLFLSYAEIINTGWLNPKEVSKKIDLSKPNPLQTEFILTEFVSSDPEKFLASLAPQTWEYAQLRKELKQLQTDVLNGGWGPQVKATRLSVGDQGSEVIKLRNRLFRMGYLPKSISSIYDLSLAHAVRIFQNVHGLSPTGTATTDTIQAINIEPEMRMQSVIVSLERSRWMNQPKDSNYVVVNIPEYKARYFEGAKVEFETPVVVGKSKENLQTPEFSKNMQFIVVNPIWHVPYSIVTEEIFPSLRNDLAAEQYITFYDNAGIQIDRSELDLTSQFKRASFPYKAKQLPGPTNPLGQVKFMFPNRHSIYLHDSPARSLFGRDYRAYSHGCIRLKRPYEFARLLLNNEGYNFDELVAATAGTDNEIAVYLKKEIPVHITYQTAWAGEDGRIHYRKDIYNRDDLIFAALNLEGDATTQDTDLEVVSVQTSFIQ